MQFTTAALLALLTGALALPPSENQYLDQPPPDYDLIFESDSPCGNFMTKAVCCRKSFLGVIDMGCHRVKPDVHTGPELVTACEAKGKMPRCCILGLLGFYSPCKPPHTVNRRPGSSDDDTDYAVDFTAT